VDGKPAKKRESGDDRAHFPAYMDIHRIFAHREKWALCEEALKAQGALTTKELALAIMAKKAMDTGDKVLAHAVANRLIHSLRMQATRGRVVVDGKRNGVCVWRLAEDGAIASKGLATAPAL